MKLGACGLLLLAILGPFASAAELILENELEETQEDPSNRKIGFGQALGYHSNNKIHTINTENQAAKSKIIEDWNKAFNKHFGGKRSIFDSRAEKSNPSIRTREGYSKKWTNEFGKLFGGQKLTQGDYSLLTGGMQQGDARRPNSKLLKQWNKAYEKYFGKKKNKFQKQWSQKYDKLFG